MKIIGAAVYALILSMIMPVAVSAQAAVSSYSTEAETSIVIALAPLFSGAHDFTRTTAENPVSGVVVVDSTVPSVTYTPESGYTGDDSFLVRVPNSSPLYQIRVPQGAQDGDDVQAEQSDTQYSEVLIEVTVTGPATSGAVLGASDESASVLAATGSEVWLSPFVGVGMISLTFYLAVRSGSRKITP